MEYTPVRVADIIRRLNRDIYLPSIQREFVWDTRQIERLFDSIMGDYPIGSFLFWRLRQENKSEWPIYEFLRDYDGEFPHNVTANMAGVTGDVSLVLDGQQRITSLLIGLRGSFRRFHYRWRKETLYLNLLKAPSINEENPEELPYEFSFRESSAPSGDKPQLWFSVGRILDFEDGEDAKSDVRDQLRSYPELLRENANRLVGRLHTRLHTITVGNYYEEKSQDPEKVLQVFVRANSSGKPLEYSDILLATATAHWETNARDEIHDFTDAINELGEGYKFGKDFVLKACLYLSETLPIQYKVKNFTKTNLTVIEANWERTKAALATTVRLMSRFGFHSKNIVAPLALLPIALYIMRSGKLSFDTSSTAEDADAQVAIRRWFVFSTLKNAFGGSSDTTLTHLRGLLCQRDPSDPFPTQVLYQSLGIEAAFSDSEIQRFLTFEYQGRYTNLVLSLIYPDRNWKDAIFHEDHIFPKSEFLKGKLSQRGYGQQQIDRYLSVFNSLANLQLLTETENLSKNASPFDIWVSTRDINFLARHSIPRNISYDFDSFETFVFERSKLIANVLRAV